MKIIWPRSSASRKEKETLVVASYDTTTTTQESQAAIISVSGIDCNAYAQNTEILRKHAQTEFCPLGCIAETGGSVRLWDNGSYLRLLLGSSVSAPIYRKLCRRCRTSFSLHPETLLKRQRYGLAFIAAWLWAFLKGAAVRERGFLEENGVKLPVNDERSSWSDSLDQQRTRPGYQLLHRWSTVFCLRAKLYIEELVNAAVATGEPPLCPDWEAAERAHGLLLAWVHWEALCRAQSPTLEVDQEEAFRQLVRTLAKVPSHKARRVSQRRYPYDVIIC